MDQRITVEDGSTLHDLLLLAYINLETPGKHPTQGVLRRSWRILRRLHKTNTVQRAKAQARRHYDLSVDFYRLFLDKDLNYSCGFFASPDDTLEQAQDAKLTRAIAKLAIRPGMTVAEIGGGWGALAIRLAQAGAHVVSINVSPEQIAIAEQAASDAGVGNQIRFVLKDYREFTGQFDRVVSVGMMEHVGIGQFDAYFAKIRDLLVPSGYAYVHSIGRRSQPGTTGPFFRKYIFPGGYVPALSETFAAIERQGLWVADMEVLRLHYHYTLRHWRTRFAKARDKAAILYDERFCRMWEFYLSVAELEFQHSSKMVFQLLLSKSVDAVPVNRDFIAQERKISKTCT
ncbi:MAG: class I SAM-dependent methyltransferase, partial [Alphaproteobacteria bacterium]